MADIRIQKIYIANDYFFQPAVLKHDEILAARVLDVFLNCLLHQILNEMTGFSKPYFFEDLTEIKNEEPISKNEPIPEPTEKPVNHEEEMRKLGFGSFEGKKEFQAAFRKWSLANHPDKKPPAEQEEAKKKFMAMKGHYDAVMELKGWKVNIQDDN